MQTDMERGQQGEQMRLLNPANLPDAPSFPNRWLFTCGGLGAGLAIGLALALWMELRDKSIRTDFFFQAEDGIRDLTVTGVQTCALPIWTVWPSSRSIPNLSFR